MLERIQKLLKLHPQVRSLLVNTWSTKSFICTTFFLCLFGAQKIWFTEKYNCVMDVILSQYKQWVDNSTIVNFATLFFLISIVVFFVCKETNKRKFDGVGISIVLFSLWYLFTDTYWEFSDSILWGCSYKIVIIVFLIAILFSKAFSLKNLINDCFAKPEPADVLTGYVYRDQKEMIDTGWEPVAKTVAGKLLASNVRENCITIGVSGAWGSGKSTFLEIVEKQSKNDFTIVRFNPWNTDGAKQLQADFFNTLSAKLNFSSDTLRAIQKYSGLLEEFKLNSVVAYFVDHLIPQEDNSLIGLKKAVQDAISNNPKPVLVIIDDVDRLEKDEIFEVLKLMRVTADFNNVAYIAAYDKAYVERQMDSRVGDAKQFLKKIFTIEIVLPSYEHVLIPKQLCLDIQKFIGNKTIRKNLYDIVAMQEDGKYVISNYLHNFRDELSFVNQFATSLQSIQLAGAINEISIEDLFVLELLRFGDSKLYNTLKDNPSSLLELFKGFNSLLEYKIKDDAFKAYLNIDSADTNFKKKVPYYYLDLLFGSSNTKRQGIKYHNNFDKYFSLRLPAYVISANDFSGLISTNEDDPITIDNSLKGKLDSILWHIGTYRLQQGEDSKAYNIIRLLLSLVDTKVSSQIPYLMRSFAVRVHFSDHSYSDKVKALLEDAINTKPAIQKSLNRILCELHSVVCYSYDPDDGGTTREEKQDILSDMVIETLANHSLSKYIERRGSVPDVSEILWPTGAFQLFLSSLVADVAYDEDYPEERQKKQLAIATLKELYGPKDHYSIKDFWKTITPTADDEMRGFDEMMWDEGETSIFNVFGERIYYKDFVDSCFTISDEEHQEFLDHMKIKLPKN